jgi:hypothetical protein
LFSICLLEEKSRPASATLSLLAFHIRQLVQSAFAACGCQSTGLAAQRIYLGILLGQVNVGQSQVRTMVELCGWEVAGFELNLKVSILG